MVIMKDQVALRTTTDIVDRRRPMEDMAVEGVEAEIGTLGHLQAEIDTVGHLQDATGIAGITGHLRSTIGTIASVTAVAVQSTSTAAGVIEIYMLNRSYKFKIVFVQHIELIYNVQNFRECRMVGRVERILNSQILALLPLLLPLPGRRSPHTTILDPHRPL
jgi:hypothetical protein